MQECLGISITDKLIRYAKVQKDNTSFKVSSFGIKFYDNLQLESSINQIVTETSSDKIPLSININNEKYYYFEIFNMASKEYIDKAINTEFESFCADNHLNKNVFDGRYTYTNSMDNSDKNKVMYIYENKSDLDQRYKLFPNQKISSATPTAIALPNIVRLEKNKNIIIVDLEDNTTVTTVVNQAIYNVDILNQGLSEVFDKINTKENSLAKTYEVCKNTTIYTMETENIENTNNEYLQFIVPALYKIAQDIQNIMLPYQKIDQIYLTGLGTAINNIDLYFQEYFKNTKVEILKPFFMEANEGINIKDYIEVNPAIALAIQGLGYGAKTLNFKKENFWENFKKLMTTDIKTTKSQKKTPKVKSEKSKLNLNWNLNMNLKGKLEKLEISLIRDCVVVFLVIIMYCIGATILQNQIENKKSEIDEILTDTNKQISAVNSDDGKINQKQTDYKKYKTNLENISSIIETKRSRKNQITTLLNKLVYNIPKEVKVTEIKNTEVTTNGEELQHITINAESSKYEQLAYFKARLKNENVLDNIVSTEGTKEGDVVKVVIEGDLKTY